MAPESFNDSHSFSLNFLIASEHALIHPQMTYIETDCAELMIEAISLQLPYIREGLITPDGTV